jgi:alpha-L-arabinofuranosidase
MRVRIAGFIAAACCLGGALAAGAQPAGSHAQEALKVTIDTQQAAPPVSKYEYGQFIEHIGTTMYSSLWAEMVDDRKFYATESAHTFDLKLTGSHLGAAAKFSELTGSSVDAINHAGQAPQIKVKEVQLSGTPGTISVAPISVNIYRFPLTQ